MFRDQNFISPNYILLSISFPGRYLLVEKNYETRHGPRRWNLFSRLVLRRLFVFRRKNCNSSCHFWFWIFFNVTWKPRWCYGFWSARMILISEIHRDFCRFNSWKYQFSNIIFSTFLGDEDRTIKLSTVIVRWRHPSNKNKRTASCSRDNFKYCSLTLGASTLRTKISYKLSSGFSKTSYRT